MQPRGEGGVTLFQVNEIILQPLLPAQHSVAGPVTRDRVPDAGLD